MSLDQIVVKGARAHNLKNVNVTIPRDKFVVLTGLSGSGKSSLAFDTIYAEGQRRYVESLSAYARQFLGQMDKPDVDSIEGLSPAISIDQKTTSLQSQVDRRYGDGDLRLSPPLVRSRGTAVLSDVRHTDCVTDRGTNGGQNSGIPGRNSLASVGARGEREKGRTPKAVR